MKACRIKRRLPTAKPEELSNAQSLKNEVQMEESMEGDCIVKGGC
jgi:hypothetical protein